MYQEQFSTHPKDSSLSVETAIDQMVSSIPLKAFRKQGLSEVRVISEKTLNDIVEKTIEVELEKRIETISREKDELRGKSESLSQELEALKEGDVAGGSEKLEKKCKALEQELTRLRTESDTRKIAFTGASTAKTSITSEKYEEKVKKIVEDILEGARGTIPVDLLENTKENLSKQLIEKFPHNTYPLRVVTKGETPSASYPQPAAATSGAAHPKPSTPVSRPGPIKSGSLFHKLVESNVQWRHKQKGSEEGQKD